jgi:uncharacterized membrane protein
MKAINYLNYFFVGVPTLLISLGYITNQSSGNLIGSGLFFMILTGLFQVVIGIQMLIDEPKNKYPKIYIVAVILFFLMLLINVQLLYSDLIYFILPFIPPVLAIYLSVIIYKKAYK